MPEEQFWKASDVVEVPIEDLRLPSRNTRAHSPAQTQILTQSIEQFGFTMPVVIDGENFVIAGAGRVEAARNYGMDKIPAVRADHLEEWESRAFAIADNRLTELGGWKDEELEDMLTQLRDDDVDMEAFGFHVPYSEDREPQEREQSPMTEPDRVVRSHAVFCPHCGHEFFIEVDVDES